MLVAEPQENEINLEKIDAEIRMEKIRQNASKLSWDGFGQAVRRNLLEKRLVFDADTRIDVINAISIMRKKMPVDENASFPQKVKQLADSLECTLTSDPEKLFLKNNEVSIEIGYTNDKLTGCRIAYWGGPLVVSEEASKMLENGEFADFRNCIFNILSMLPSSLPANDRNACKNVLQEIETNLLEEAGELSVKGINSGKGFFLPPSSLQPGRLYFFADRLFEKHYGTPTVDENDLDVLPYLELSLVSNDKPNAAGIEACICLKFSDANLFSSNTLRRLEKFIAKAPLVRHYTNQYRYMGGREKLTGNMHLLTNFPAEYTQHHYEIDVRSLTAENDPVLVEIYIKEFGMLSEVVSIIRSEWVHNNLWESILAFCVKTKRAEGAQGVIHVKTILERRRFEFIFSTNVGLINAEMQEQKDGTWAVRTVLASTGSSVSEELDRRMTEKLNSTWSVPRALLLLSAHLNCRISPMDPHHFHEATAATNDSEKDDKSAINAASSSTSSVFKTDKVGFAWLTRTQQLKELKNQPEKSEEEGNCGKKAEKEGAKPKKLVIDLSKKVKNYERQKDGELRGGLLAMFAEPDESLRPLPVPKPADRLRRMESANSAAFMELDKIRMMTNSSYDGIGNQALSHYNHNSLEQHHMMMQQQMMRPTQLGGPMGGPMGGPQMPQMSPLDSARMQMKQSMGAAQAVALAAHTPSPTANNQMAKELFEFPDDMYMGGSPTASASSSSPQHYPMARGGGKTRRPRARKTGNMGDRMPSMDQFGQIIPSPPTGRGRGRGRGRGAGTRKNPVMPPQMEMMNVMEQQNNMMMRPQIQRSFSDYPHPPPSPMSMQPHSMQMPPPMSPMHQMQMQMQQQQHQQHQMQQFQQMQQQQQHHPMQHSMPPMMPSNQSMGQQPQQQQQQPDEESDDECDPPPPPKMMGPPATPNTMPLQSPNNQPLTPSPLAHPQKPWNQNPMEQVPMNVDLKPELSVLNKMLMKDDSPPMSGRVEEKPVTMPPPTTPTKRKGLGLEAAISKIKGQQQARAEVLADLFDDGVGGKTPSSVPTTPTTPGPMVERKPFEGMGTSGSSKREESLEGSSGSGAEVSKVTIVEPTKLTIKLPKLSRNSPSVDQQKAKQQQQAPYAGLSSSSVSAMPKLEKEKIRENSKEKERSEKKKKEKERGEKDAVSMEKVKKEKKRKYEKKEKDPKEPKEKKSKIEGMPSTSSSKSTKDVLNILPLRQNLKNFKIPKKESNEDMIGSTAPPKEEPTTSATSSSTTPISSIPLPSASSAPPQRKDSAPLISPSLPPSSQEAGYREPPHFFRDGPPKKKSSSSLLSGGVGGGGGTPTYGSSGSSGRRKQGSVPPPLPRGNIPGYGGGGGGGSGRESGGTRGYPGGPARGGGYDQKQVASYAQGLPPGMGPPAVGSGGWGRPPSHRDYHAPTGSSSSSSHQSSVGHLKEKDQKDHHKERGGAGGSEDRGPDSPEEMLKIADE